LRAMEEMAKLMGEDALATMYGNRFIIGSKNLNTLCWSSSSGFYVNVGYDPGYYALGGGCFIDQLLGQWWAHALGLGYVLPKENVALTVQSILSHNFQVGFNPKDEGPRIFMDERDSGLWICRWPDGGKPPNPMLYNSECWSGVEYPVAGMAYWERLNAVGDKIVDAVRARQDGTRRSPWNEVECGDHYSRPQSSWMLFESASGFHWDGVLKKMEWAPRFTPQQFGGFWITASGWGTFNQQGSNKMATGTVQLIPQYGTLQLNSLQLESTATKANVTLNGNTIPNVTVTQTGAVLIISFKSTVTVSIGQNLSATLS